MPSSSPTTIAADHSDSDVAQFQLFATSDDASRQTTLIAHDDTTIAGPELSASAASSGAGATSEPANDAPSVRFASPTEVIPPTIITEDDSVGTPSSVGGFQATVTPPPPTSSPPPTDRGVSEESIAELSQSLKEANLKNKNRIAFEPIASLPPSRMPSHEYLPMGSPRQRPADANTSGPSSSMASINSPPLTPSGTDGDFNGRAQNKHQTTGNGDSVITPQPSSSQDTSPRPGQSEFPKIAKASADHLTPRPNTAESNARQNNHRHGMFSLGPGGSTPNSRESSPSRAGSYYSRPFTPAGDSQNNPYAASKRTPQITTQIPKHVEARFHFTRKKKHGSPSSSSASLLSPDKRHHHKDDLGHIESNATSKSSMVDLKRFFKKGSLGHKSDKLPGGKHKTSTVKASHSMPFGEDHGLVTKYGKFGKVLGSGAGGSVRVMKRSDDNTVFAVKEFRARHTYESEKEYAKKLTGEFCIGSTLHHGNVIETLDIIQERGRWFVVMEYAPFDLFAIVMTGRMSRAEVSCCFLQILNGVTYLHSMGLAHRDLKLDNVVVSANGIMKIIDFGSAHVFSYPFEEGIIKAKGIVGSDPYLAPEVYEEKQLYDPRAVDIWSLGIIYCCMTLRRFPWKVPRLTDNSYKLFAAEPTPGHDPAKILYPQPKETKVTSPSVGSSGDQGDYFSSHHGSSSNTQAQTKHHHHFGPATVPVTPGSKPTSPAAVESRAYGRHKGSLDPMSPHPSTPCASHQEKKESIKGPWRILRLLPKESRKVINGMLTIDPTKRMTMDEIINDEWVSNTVICQQLEGGEVTSATDHKHTLEPPMSASQAPPKPPAGR